MSGKKAKHQILVDKATITPYKCDNFVAIVVPGLSSDTNISGSAGDAAENTPKVSTERPACKAGIEKSIARLARMVCRMFTNNWWTHNRHLLNVAEQFLENCIVQIDRGRLRPMTLSANFFDMGQFLDVGFFGPRMSIKNTQKIEKEKITRENNARVGKSI